MRSRQAPLAIATVIVALLLSILACSTPGSVKIDTSDDDGGVVIEIKPQGNDPDDAEVIPDPPDEVTPEPPSEGGDRSTVISVEEENGEAESSGIPEGAVQAQLVEVVDGDTIKVRIDGKTESVRYFGIDTPERDQPGYQAATEANRKLLGNGPIYLVAEQTNRDKYDRLLRYVYAADGTFVDLEMVRQGWAQPVEYPPDLRHAAEARAAAVEAAQNGSGFWSGTSPDGAMSYGITVRGANVRKEPSTDAEISGGADVNTTMTIFGRTEAADWFQVRLPDRSGGWMYGELIRINVPADQIPVTWRTPPPPPPTPEEGTTSPPGKVEISYIYYDGEEPQVEGDEYAVIKNTGDAAVNLAGWRLNADDEGQDFWFPAIELAPGQECRVYTNRNDPNTCGLTYGHGKSGLWANSGECGRLYNADGAEVSKYCYP